MEEANFISVVVGVIALILNIILIVKFFIISADVAAIKNRVNADRAKFKCKHCGFVSYNVSDFCPVCGKNADGKTLKELQEAVK